MKSITFIFQNNFVTSIALKFQIYTFFVGANNIKTQAIDNKGKTYHAFLFTKGNNCLRF